MKKRMRSKCMFYIGILSAFLAAIFCVFERDNGKFACVSDRSSIASEDSEVSNAVDSIDFTRSYGPGEREKKPLEIKSIAYSPEEVKYAEAEEVREIEEKLKEEPDTLYFDVPLDRDLQDHIFKLCEEADIDPAIVIAMIEKESGYTADILGDNGNSYGLMQIQPRWHYDRMERLECYDLLDPYQNVTVGIDFLAELKRSDKSIEWVLMAYNGGPAYANRKISNGEISDYARLVLECSENLNRIE